MATTPRAVRPLPSSPALDREPGAETGLVTRIVIVATAVLGQLFALTVGLEESLLDHDAKAWLLAGFSVVSFVVVIVLTRVDPPPRARRLRGRANTETLYVPRAVPPQRQRG
ncbi:MAG TPA: hypothetical protein VFF40_04550 [Acidimicrobiia bacterium]|nr:hypothetical protein [Acidimicrobiia bacterium]